MFEQVSNAREGAMKQLLSAMMVLFVLVGCETTYVGETVINQKIKVNNKKQEKKKRGGLLGRIGFKKKVWVDTQTTINQGSYHGKVEIDDKKIKMKLEGAGIPSLVFLMNKRIAKKLEQNHFVLPSHLTGQSFEMEGKKDTEYDRSLSQTEIQHCTIRKVRTVCKKVCEQIVINSPESHSDHDLGNNGDGKGKKKGKKKGDKKGKKKGPKTKVVCKNVCTEHVKYIDGAKKVDFHYLTTTNHLNVSFVQEGAILGEFSGSNSSTSKIIDFTGKCRRRW